VSGEEKAMRHSALDELMIVNPGGPDRVRRVRLDAVRPQEPQLFLGDDGIVYRKVPALAGCRCGLEHRGSAHVHFTKER
jgi:hypothetical protein